MQKSLHVVGDGIAQGLELNAIAIHADPAIFSDPGIIEAEVEADIL
jgi:hypothetical protein